MKDLPSLRVAAERGDRDAQFELGGLYRLGERVRRNRVVALKLFILAAWAGDSDADMQVTLLGDELREEQKERALASALRWKFKRDMGSVIERMVNTTELLSDERPVPDHNGGWNRNAR